MSDNLTGQGYLSAHMPWRGYGHRLDGRCCIVCGVTGLHLRTAIFPLKRLLALGVTITADAQTGELLGRSALPVELFHADGDGYLPELERRMHAGDVALAFLQGIPWFPLARLARVAGVPCVTDLEGLVDAVEVMEAPYRHQESVIGPALSRETGSVTVLPSQ